MAPPVQNQILLGPPPRSPESMDTKKPAARSSSDFPFLYQYGMVQKWLQATLPVEDPNQFFLLKTSQAWQLDSTSRVPTICRCIRGDKYLYRVRAVFCNQDGEVGIRQAEDTLSPPPSLPPSKVRTARKLVHSLWSTFDKLTRRRFPKRQRWLFWLMFGGAVCAPW